jgi:hypothetical protein
VTFSHVLYRYFAINIVVELLQADLQICTILKRSAPVNMQISDVFLPVSLAWLVVCNVARTCTSRFVLAGHA